MLRGEGAEVGVFARPAAFAALPSPVPAPPHPPPRQSSTLRVLRADAFSCFSNSGDRR